MKALRENLWLFKIILSAASVILTMMYSSEIINLLPEIKGGFSDDGIFLSAENIEKDLQEIHSSEEKCTSVTEVITTASTIEETTSAEYEKREYETPDDVKQMETEYLAVFNETEASGDIEEVFFKTSGATHSADGIHIKNATATKSPDFSALLNEGPDLSIEDKSKPVILIFHTHTTESYLLADNGVFYDSFSTRSTDSSKNMLRVGKEICKVLEENGIGYIHDENVYDESYNGAYSRSRVTVEKYLSEYPSIKIVLDVHRDAIYYSDTSHCKPTAEINGRKAAQIMIITGAEEGYIENFPYWEDNLKFALHFQKTAETLYPGLMKPVYFCQRKYNMDTAKCSLLLEMGTDANTLDEALYTAFLTGNILTEIVNNASGEKLG